MIGRFGLEAFTRHLCLTLFLLWHFITAARLSTVFHHLCAERYRATLTTNTGEVLHTTADEQARSSAPAELMPDRLLGAASIPPEEGAHVRRLQACAEFGFYWSRWLCRHTTDPAVGFL